MTKGIIASFLIICWVPLAFATAVGGPCKISFISGAALKLRAEPDPNSKIISVLKFNQKVCRLDQVKTGWEQIHLPDGEKTGWIKTGWLAKEETSESQLLSLYDSSIIERHFSDAVKFAERAVDSNESLANLQRLKIAIDRTNDSARSVALEKKISILLNGEAPYKSGFSIESERIVKAVFSKCTNPETKKLISALNPNVGYDAYVVQLFETLAKVTQTSPMKDEYCISGSYGDAEVYRSEIIDTLALRLGGVLPKVMDGARVSRALLKMDLQAINPETLYSLALSFSKGSNERNKILRVTFDRDVSSCRENYMECDAARKRISEIGPEINRTFPEYKKVGVQPQNDECYGMTDELIFVRLDQLKKFEANKLCQAAIKIYSQVGARFEGGVGYDMGGDGKKPALLTDEGIKNVKNILSLPEFASEIGKVKNSSQQEKFLYKLSGKLVEWSFIDDIWGECSKDFDILFGSNDRADCG